MSGTRLESGENVGQRNTRGNTVLKSVLRNNSLTMSVPQSGLPFKVKGSFSPSSPLVRRRLLCVLDTQFSLRKKLESLPTRRVSYHHFSLQHILELTISSMAFSRWPISCSQSPVALHEIFDMSHNSIAADFSAREELSNMRICVNLPNEVHDWEGLRRALAEEGMEITVKDKILCISGYASRNDYNYEREIRATVARFRRVSQSSSGKVPLENKFLG